MSLIRVGIRFERGEITDPVLADALIALEAVEIRAASVEVGEHHAQQLVDALEAVANREVPG